MLTPEERNLLTKAGKRQSLRRRQTLYLPGDPADSVYLVLSGLLRVAKSAHRGREITLLLYEKGDLFAESTLFGETMRTQTAEALLPSEVMLIPADKMRKILDENPSMLNKFNQWLWRKNSLYEQRLEELAFHDVPARLARSIMALAEKYSDRNGKKATIIFKITHQELSSLVGTTRETATLMLNRLRSAGAVTSAGRQIIVSDMDTLSSIAATPSNE